MQFFKIFKIFFFNFLLLIILLTIIEIIFGKWFSSEIDCRYVLCNINNEMSHGIFGEPYNSRYIKDSYGLRGDYNDISEIHSLFIGGSTTDQRWFGLQDTWVHLSQEIINQRSDKKFVFANGGIDGQSTLGHIWNFENWFNKIPNLKPKYLFFYIGLNDFVPNLHSPRYDNVRFSLFDRIYTKLYNSSIVFELYKILSRLYNAKKYKYIFISDYKKLDLKYKELSIKKNNFWNDYKEYYLNLIFENRINNLINLTIEMNAIPIFVTQKSARWKEIDDIYYGANCCGEIEIKFDFLDEVHRLNYADIGVAETLISKKIIEICNSRLLRCYDGFLNYNIEVENTYDLFHTNIEGNKEIASKFSEFFIQNIDIYDNN